jgi:hypothetical protein
VDPCAGSQEVKADFKIENRVGPSPAEAYYLESEGSACFPLDNYGTGIIRLTALQDSLEYKWIIGSDTIYNQEYSFLFGEEFCGGTYPLTLIVSGQPDTACFPNDNGLDTLTKMIHIVEGFDNPIYGKYKVAWSDQPNDSFEVKLSIASVPGPSFLIYAHNFHRTNTNDSCAMDRNALNYNFLELYCTYNLCRRLNGKFWINPDNSFEADYEIDVDPGPLLSQITMVRKHAKGRKIQ